MVRSAPDFVATSGLRLEASGVGNDPVSGAEILEAMTLMHREEIAKLSMQVARYRWALEKNGIEPPDESGADLLKMWRRCMQMINHATLFAQELGSEKELLEVWS